MKLGKILKMNDNCDFTLNAFEDMRKEVLESKPDLKAAVEHSKKTNEALQKMSTEEIERVFNILYEYNYGYMYL